MPTNIFEKNTSSIIPSIVCTCTVVFQFEPVCKNHLYPYSTVIKHVELPGLSSFSHHFANLDDLFLRARDEISGHQIFGQRWVEYDPRSLKWVNLWGASSQQLLLMSSFANVSDTLKLWDVVAKPGKTIIGATYESPILAKEHFNFQRINGT